MQIIIFLKIMSFLLMSTILPIFLLLLVSKRISGNKFKLFFANVTPMVSCLVDGIFVFICHILQILILLASFVVRKLIEVRKIVSSQSADKIKNKIILNEGNEISQECNGNKSSSSDSIFSGEFNNNENNCTSKLRRDEESQTCCGAMNSFYEDNEFENYSMLTNSFDGLTIDEVECYCNFLVRCDSVFRRGMYCCVILWTDMPCDDMPCYDMPCDDMPCDDMLCYDMPCDDMLCYDMPCYVLSHIYVVLIQFLFNLYNMMQI